MADTNEIPPVIRQAFGPALDEPAPPPPTEPGPEEGDGDGGHHHHVHIQMVVPKVMVLSDGSTRTDGWAGSLLVGWCWLATFVTVAAALWASWAYLPTILIYGITGVVMVLGWIVLGAIAEIERQRLAAWWRARRRTPEASA